MIVLFAGRGYSQNSFWERRDSMSVARVSTVSASVGVIWGGSITGLSEIWYADVAKTKFHSIDDFHNWLQMDKGGHFYTANKINALCTDLYRWSGLKENTSLILGAGISLGYQTSLELLDASSLNWGFSWSDMTFNVLGTAWYTGQYLLWKEERIIPKFSYSPTKFAAVRPEVFGSTPLESFLKDYNGHTYWLSISPGKFLPKSKIPKWICLSLGYSVDEKLIGSKEVYVDPHTGVSYFSNREFLLSMDIDFSALDIKRPWLKVLVKQFNYIKVPFPALLFRGNTTYLRGIYF